MKIILILFNEEIRECMKVKNLFTFNYIPMANGTYVFTPTFFYILLVEVYIRNVMFTILKKI